MNVFGKLLGVFLALSFWHGMAHADLAKPTGQVVLTIGGNVANANMSAPDEFGASFLKSFEYDYTRAAAFDIAMLEALGTVKITIRAEPWPRAVAFEGPRLRDVLDAAGWTGEKITTVGLDGFTVEITKEDIAARDWIVAVKGDGRYLNIGGRGPAWLVYEVPGGKASADDDARWPWAMFYIVAE